MLEVGRIGRAHGVRGALYVDLLTDRTERLAPGARVQAKGIWLVVESARRAGNRWLVQFAGLADRTAAEAYVGTPILAAALPPTDDAGWYVHDLIGAEVFGVDGQAYGRCIAVIANPAHDLLELDGGALVPVVFITSVSAGVGVGRVEIDPPDGLFDLLP